MSSCSKVGVSDPTTRFDVDLGPESEVEEHFTPRVGGHDRRRRIKSLILRWREMDYKFDTKLNIEQTGRCFYSTRKISVKFFF